MRSKMSAWLACVVSVFALVSCDRYGPTPRECVKSSLDVRDEGPPKWFDLRGIWLTRDDISLKLTDTTYTICQGFIRKDEHDFYVKNRFCEQGKAYRVTSFGGYSVDYINLVDFGKTKIGAEMFSRITHDIPHWNSFFTDKAVEGDVFGEWDYRFEEDGIVGYCESDTCSTLGGFDQFRFTWHLQDPECLGEWADALFAEGERSAPGSSN